MVYTINEQIPLRYSIISTYRDMYLEVIECLSDVNKNNIEDKIPISLPFRIIILYYNFSSSLYIKIKVRLSKLQTYQLEHQNDKPKRS